MRTFSLGSTRTLAGMWGLALVWAAMGCSGPTEPGAPALGQDGGVSLPDAGAPQQWCAPQWRGVQRLGGPADDAMGSVVFAPGGRLLVGGYVYGDLAGARHQPGGDARGVVLALERDGAALWEAPLSTGGSDVVEDLWLQQDGKVLVLGRSTGNWPGFNNGGFFDVFLAGLDAVGDQLWLYSSGGETAERARRLAVRGDRAVVAGFHEVFIPTNYVERWEDGLAWQFDLGGVPSRAPQQGWSHQDGSPSPDVVNHVAMDSNGNVALVGVMQGGTRVQRGPYVMLLNAQGGQVWRTQLNPVAVDTVAGVAFDGNGHVQAVGSFLGPVNGALGPSDDGEQHAVLVELDVVTGEILQARRLAPDAPFYVWDAVRAENGTWALAGETTGGFIPGATPNGTSDAALLVVARDGTELLRWRDGSLGDDSLRAVALSPCGTVAAAGYAEGNLGLGGPARGGLDGVVVHLSLPR